MHKNCLCFYAHALYIELQLQTIIFYILISMLLLKNNFFFNNESKQFKTQTQS